jgi:hypothetical protein
VSFELCMLNQGRGIIADGLAKQGDMQKLQLQLM